MQQKGTKKCTILTNFFLFFPVFDPDCPSFGFSGLTALLCIFVIVNANINSD